MAFGDSQSWEWKLLKAAAAEIRHLQKDKQQLETELLRLRAIVRTGSALARGQNTIYAGSDWKSVLAMQQARSCRAAGGDWANLHEGGQP